MIIGTLPVVIAICSNLRDAQRDGKLLWLRLLPLRNADGLRAHADRPASTWATAQGIATLPLPEPQALAGIMLLVAGVLWALRVRPEPAVEHGS